MYSVTIYYISELLSCTVIFVVESDDNVIVKGHESEGRSLAEVDNQLLFRLSSFLLDV